MMEVLQMTSSDGMNEKAIRKHHRENILSYGETHNGIVPKYIVAEEARATLALLADAAKSGDAAQDSSAEAAA